MTQFLLPPGFRATDADDNPLAGGYYKFYAGGTTTPKAVYSDASLSTSLGTTVNLNSAGTPVSGANTPVLIYLNTGSYKVELYDADDTLLFTFDNIPGAGEEETASTTALPDTPVISKSSAYTVTSAERGKLINANTTGGSFSITAPSAVAMGDGFRFGVRHNGSANQVSIVSSGSQFVRAHKALRSYALTGMGETAWFVSDGSDWIVDGYHPPFWKAPAPYFRVLDRLTAPPANPNAGARYLINGTPTGAWSTLGFAQNDIAEADGNGSWIRLTPETGWMAFDADEEQTLQFKDGTWENFQIDPGTSTLKTLIVQDQKASGTHGGTPTIGAWTTAVLNTSVVNTIPNSSLASNTITLPAGRYRVTATKVFYFTDDSRIRFKTVSDSSVVLLGECVRAGFNASADEAAAISVIATVTGEFEIAESTDFILQYWATANITSGTGSPSRLGRAVSTGDNEVYATVLIEDLASLQGPKGDQGDQGADGQPGALSYQFNTATSGDPGAGKFLINNASPVSATALHISETDANGADLSALVSIFDDSTSTKKAIVLATKVGAPNNVMSFRITGAGTDEGAYWSFPIEYVAHDGSISNNNDTAFVVIPIGEKGDVGDPAVLNPVGAYDNGTEYNLFDIVTDQGSTWVAKTTTTGNPPPTLPTTSNTQWLLLAERGPPGQDGTGTGDVVGPASSTNSALVEFDGTTGKLIKDGGVVVSAFAKTVLDDADAATARTTLGLGTSDSPQFTGIELGHASDTTVTRAASGKLAVEGVNLLRTAGDETITGGFAATSVDDGTKSSGTFTPTFLGGNVRRYINGGAHTLAPPTGEGTMIIQVTNNGSAGTITTSGFTKVSGDTITTTNGHDFMFMIVVINGFSHLHVTALQ